MWRKKISFAAHYHARAVSPSLCLCVFVCEHTKKKERCNTYYVHFTPSLSKHTQTYTMSSAYTLASTYSTKKKRILEIHNTEHTCKKHRHWEKNLPRERKKKGSFAFSFLFSPLFLLLSGCLCVCVCECVPVEQHSLSAAKHKGGGKEAKNRDGKDKGRSLEEMTVSRNYQREKKINTHTRICVFLPALYSSSSIAVPSSPPSGRESSVHRARLSRSSCMISADSLCCSSSSTSGSLSASSKA